ncbi:hypothetical protein [Tenacibaculum mesophilum]|uniref:hypothetical protein n=1 Tax=Tenacibaculum mesophilum TaxID=104268 RepID=UPI0006494979|nr:hypothetical protein [Tenacibaculum mesophilum]
MADYIRKTQEELEKQGHWFPRDIKGLSIKFKKKMKTTETTQVLGLIEELKMGITSDEIESIEEEKENIIWSKVDDTVKDLWYETLGDAKRGVYN